MRNRNWLKSDSQQRQLFAGLIASSLRRARQAFGLLACAVIWTALVLNLTGCASPSAIPCPPQTLPQPPALTEQIPSVSYSLRAQQSFKAWQERLIATPVTP